MGGREGVFSMCIFWFVEVMICVGVYELKYFVCVVNIFENMFGFLNYLFMFFEEIV